MTKLENKAARLAAVIYTAISLGVVLLFVVLTFLTGKPYPVVARVGGAIWVFILAMIVTMPIVIPKVNNKLMA